MAAEPSSIVTRLTDRRIEYLIRQAQGTAVPHETTGQMAARWGVSIRWLRKLVQRWRRTGKVPRLNPHRRPPAEPLTESQVQLVREEWNRQRRGATKLYQALCKRGIRIPKMQIYRLAKSQGWVVPNPRKQRSRRYVRYERTHSGSLLHGDFHRTSDEHPHCILWEDDASRFVLAGGEFPEATAGHAIDTLRDALRQAGRWGLEVREVNTDRGSQFFINEKLTEESRPYTSSEGQFQRFLLGQGIRHVVSRAHHPQTNGKLERLWLEYDRHRWRHPSVEAWVAWYNDQIHESLWSEQLETPKEAWQRKIPPAIQLGQFLRRTEREEATA